jgi:hypothetical protein
LGYLWRPVFGTGGLKDEKSIKNETSNCIYFRIIHSNFSPRSVEMGKDS